MMVITFVEKRRVTVLRLDLARFDGARSLHARRVVFAAGLQDSSQARQASRRARRGRLTAVTVTRSGSYRQRK